MPKLEGVKVLDMKDGEVTRIEYEGEVYTKIDGGQSDIFRKSEQTERKPKPGDKIRIVNAHHVTRGKYKNGDILTVKKYIRGNEIINERVIVEEFEAPAVFLDEFEFVDESELKPTVNVGDFAKVVGETFWGVIKKGTIVKITDEADAEGDIRIELIDESVRDWAKAESLEKVNPTNQELSFYRAGRNLGELKDGDIVRVIQHTGAHDKGVIVEITGDGKRYKFGDIDFYSADWEFFELVAPVENRTDIERSESDE